MDRRPILLISRSIRRTTLTTGLDCVTNARRVRRGHWTFFNTLRRWFRPREFGDSLLRFLDVRGRFRISRHPASMKQKKPPNHVGGSMASATQSDLSLSQAARTDDFDSAKTALKRQVTSEWPPDAKSRRGRFHSGRTIPRMLVRSEAAALTGSWWLLTGPMSGRRRIARGSPWWTRGFDLEGGDGQPSVGIVARGRLSHGSSACS